MCIQGGLPKDLDGCYYVQLLRAIKARLPELHIHAYSPMEITYGVEKTRLPLREYLLMLKEAGLGSIPGTAAEILDDEVRRSLSPNKLKVRQWIEVIRTAHSLGIPTTSTMMYGHTETSGTLGAGICFCSARFRRKPADSPNLFRWDSSIPKPSFSRAGAPARAIRSTRI